MCRFIVAPPAQDELILLYCSLLLFWTEPHSSHLHSLFSIPCPLSTIYILCCIYTRYSGFILQSFNQNQSVHVLKCPNSPQWAYHGDFGSICSYITSIHSRHKLCDLCTHCTMQQSFFRLEKLEIPINYKLFTEFMEIVFFGLDR